MKTRKKLLMAVCLMTALCVLGGCSLSESIFDLLHAYLAGNVTTETPADLPAQKAGQGFFDQIQVPDKESDQEAAGEPTGTPEPAYTPEPTAEPALSDSVVISREQYEKYRKFDKVIELMDYAEAYFYKEVDETALLDGAAQGLMSGLDDPYSFYYNPEDFAKMWEDDEGEYAGIGIQITSNYLTQICTISRVFDNGPSKEAGVQKGDILYKVEDLFVTANNVQDAVDIMRGTPGTDVNVTFLRDGQEMNYVLTRTQIQVNQIESMMLDDGIGYIALYEFSGKCADEFATHLEKLVQQDMKGLIIDLRDNPGGWVDDACSIGDLFLDKGDLCYLVYNDGSEEHCYRTKNGKYDLKLTLLVNESSASSSEILTGALRDRANAAVVGVKTYGKGIVQSVLPVSNDGSGCQITIAQYFTPNGTAVHKIGITPDVIAELPEGDNGMYNFGDLADPQLQKALEVMKQQLDGTWVRPEITEEDTAEEAPAA
ncbi:MAG: S41 family peptidase [Clostridia bacterium]|nr:S41 family peptidase [Clostridia bacterium]